MDVKKLCKEQKRIDNLINQQARKCGLATDDIGPIRDGINDEKGYLSSPLKVAWILKEAYDDFDEEGNPFGGYWSLPKDCFKKDDAWHNPVWQKIAYVMHGFRNNLTWNEMPWIREHHEMIDEILTIAWINASKMPAQKSSNNSVVANNFYSYWKDVVMEQLKVYAPDVIVFGKTFDFMQYCFPEPERVDALSNDWVNYYRCGGQILLDTYHPGRKGQAYVDALIETLHNAKVDLGR